MIGEQLLLIILSTADRSQLCVDWRHVQLDLRHFRGRLRFHFQCYRSALVGFISVNEADHKKHDENNRRNHLLHLVHFGYVLTNGRLLIFVYQVAYDTVQVALVA